MKLYLAQYTSPRWNQVPGYNWQNISPQIKSNDLALLQKLWKFPEDGRTIPSDALFGGYLAVPAENKILFYRFLYGGQDAMGREGVVLMNCAQAELSDVYSQNLLTIFNSPCMTSPCTQGRETESSISLSLNLFSNNPSVLNDNETLDGEQINKVLCISQTSFGNTTTHVAITISNGQRTATVTRIAPPQPKRQPTVQRSNSDSTKHGMPDFSLSWTKLIGICAVAIIGLFVFNLTSKSPRKPRPDNGPRVVNIPANDSTDTRNKTLSSTDVKIEKLVLSKDGTAEINITLPDNAEYILRSTQFKGNTMRLVIEPTAKSNKDNQTPPTGK